jgi:hypothetical protein
MKKAIEVQSRAREGFSQFVMRIGLWITLLLCCTTLFAQDEWTCGGADVPPQPQSLPCGLQSPQWSQIYNAQAAYIPGTPLTPTTSVKTILVAINIWQKDDGSMNYANTPANVAAMQEAIDF